MNESVVGEVRGEVTRRLTAHLELEEEAGHPRPPDDQLRELAGEYIAEALARRVHHALAVGKPALARTEEDEIARAVEDAIFGLAGFERYLADDRIENIDANGADQVWVKYADGRRERVDPVASSDDELLKLLANAAARLGLSERSFDATVAHMSARLPDGSRLFAVRDVTARPCVSIRRHRIVNVTLEDLERRGTLDRCLREFLGAAARARKNIIFAGGMGAGKTTLLRATAEQIPHSERLVTIEDLLELDLKSIHPNVVEMEARMPNTEGEGEITQAQLVRWALRMSATRVFVGEVRGEEVIPMLNAMSQGNDGSMCTLHASSSREAFGKLAMYAIQAPERLPLEATNLLVANAVDFVVFIEENAHGTRYVSSVREIVGADGPMVVSNEIFQPGPNGPAVPGAGISHGSLVALEEAGFDAALLGSVGGGWAA